VVTKIIYFRKRTKNNHKWCRSIAYLTALLILDLKILRLTKIVSLKRYANLITEKRSQSFVVYSVYNIISFDNIQIKIKYSSWSSVAKSLRSRVLVQHRNSFWVEKSYFSNLFEALYPNSVMISFRSRYQQIWINQLWLSWHQWKTSVAWTYSFNSNLRKKRLRCYCNNWFFCELDIRSTCHF